MIRPFTILSVSCMFVTLKIKLMYTATVLDKTFWVADTRPQVPF